MFFFIKDESLNSPLRKLLFSSLKNVLLISISFNHSNVEQVPNILGIDSHMVK